MSLNGLTGVSKRGRSESRRVKVGGKKSGANGNAKDDQFKNPIIVVQLDQKNFITGKVNCRDRVIVDRLQELWEREGVTTTEAGEGKLINA